MPNAPAYAKVLVPYSIANFGALFDIAGLAIEGVSEEISVRFHPGEEGFEVRVRGWLLLLARARRLLGLVQCRLEVIGMFLRAAPLCLRVLVEEACSGFSERCSCLGLGFECRQASAPLQAWCVC